MEEPKMRYYSSLRDALDEAVRDRLPPDLDQADALRWAATQYLEHMNDQQREDRARKELRRLCSSVLDEVCTDGEATDYVFTALARLRAERQKAQTTRRALGELYEKVTRVRADPSVLVELALEFVRCPEPPHAGAMHTLGWVFSFLKPDQQVPVASDSLRAAVIDAVKSLKSEHDRYVARVKELEQRIESMVQVARGGKTGG